MSARTLASKGVDCEIPHRLERGTSIRARHHAICQRMLGFEKGWIVRSHIDWREKRVSVRTLASKGWIVRSYIDWREERV